MEALSKSIMLAFAGLLFSASVGFAEEQFIDPELLDIDKIRQEENIGEESKLERVYMFLAVLNHDGDGYETYAARGDEDRSGDGSTLMEEPNNLEDYEKAGQFNQVLSISRNIHVCYITSLPLFEDLFPGENDPIEREGAIVEITTEETENNGELRILLGSRVLPVLGPTGNAEGFRLFKAFYNVVDEEIGDEEEQTTRPVVTSYGFIGMDFRN